MSNKDKATYANKSKTGDEKKGSVSDAGYNEENEKHPDHTKKNPAAAEKKVKPRSSEEKL